MSARNLRESQDQTDSGSGSGPGSQEPILTQEELNALNQMDEELALVAGTEPVHEDTHSRRRVNIDYST